MNLYFRQNSTSDRPRYLCFRTRTPFTYLIIQQYGNVTCFSLVQFSYTARCLQLLSMSLPPSECRHMLARLVLIILLRAPDGSTHAENITSKTFACDLNPSLLLHHANKSVQRHYFMTLDRNICTAQYIFFLYMSRFWLLNSKSMLYAQSKQVCTVQILLF